MLTHKAALAIDDNRKSNFLSLSLSLSLSLDEFDNKIFIIVADHGMTAMPEKFTYKSKDLDGTTIDVEVEPPCKLVLDFIDPDYPAFITRAQKDEKANNNLHIWELAEAMRAVGKFTRGNYSYKVLSPESIATLYSEEEFGGRSSLTEANVIATLNGPMAHIYLNDTDNWTNLPSEDAFKRFAEVLRLLYQEENIAEAEDVLGLTQKGYKDLRSSIGRLKSSIDKILVKVNGSYCVFDGLNDDGTIKCAMTDPFDANEYVRAWLRINGLNNPDQSDDAVERSGDIVLIMKDRTDSTPGSELNRYTAGVACKAWHGSLNPSDSYVPFILAYPGGNKEMMADFVENLSECSDGPCTGNWDVTDVVKRIISLQYK